MALVNIWSNASAPVTLLLAYVATMLVLCAASLAMFIRSEISGKNNSYITLREMRLVKEEAEYQKILLATSPKLYPTDTLKILREKSRCSNCGQTIGAIGRRSGEWHL